MSDIGHCSNPGCEIASGGNCLEGFKNLDECPHHSTDADPDVEISQKTLDPNQVEIESIPDRTDIRLSTDILSSGNSLDGIDANPLTRERNSTLVVLAGMVDSGKTTVLAELFDRFRKAPFAGYSFAGSQTLMGFEQVCHLSKAVSQASAAGTKRTNISEDKLLHMDLLEEEGGHRHRLLMSDLSGEKFEDATKSSEDLRRLPFMERADHFVLFVDAEVLKDPRTRQTLANQALVLMRACTENKTLSPATLVTIALSKVDQWKSYADDVFYVNLMSSLQERVDSYFDHPANLISLASRPEPPQEQSGLDTMLRLWLKASPQCAPVIHRPIVERSTVSRQIDQFAFVGGPHSE